MKRVFFFLLLIAFGLAANNNIHAETENFVLDVTGNQNVPKYTFYLKSDAKNVHSVQFGQMYECSGDPCKKNGNSEVALASLDWSYSSVSESDKELSFNITSGPAKGSQFSSVQFRNHLTKQGNETNPETAIKFDVLINNYKWVSGNDAKLVLVFSLSGEDVVFESTSTAQGQTGTVTASLSSSDKGKTKSITYGNFGTWLEHDPTIGISGVSPLTVSWTLFVLAAIILTL